MVESENAKQEAEAREESASASDSSEDSGTGLGDAFGRLNEQANSAYDRIINN